MKENNSKFKTLAIVILTNIIVIAAAVGIALGVSAVTGPKKPVEEKSPYTIKVNEATGAEEYYDEEGNFAYQVNKEYADTENKLLSREIYADKDKKTTKIVYYKDDAKTVDRVDEYKDGQVSLQHTYKEGKDTGEYWKYEYDENGVLCNSLNFGADDSLIMKKEETHNKDGKPVLFQETDAQGNIISKTEYFYDKKGNEIKAVFYDSEGQTGYVEYEYTDGRVSRMDQYKNDKLIEYRLFKYDKDGNCTQEVHDAKEAAKK